MRIKGNTKGGAAADYDHDGDLDLAWVDSYSAVWNVGGMRLLRNDTPKVGHWLEASLVATASNRSAIGARVSARVGKLRMVRQVVGGAGAHGQESLVVHFGFPGATNVDELKVEWPSGAVNTWRDLAADQLHVLTEQVNDHVGLAADPSDVAGDETLTLTTAGGSPGMLALLAVVDVDGAPTFIDIDLGTLDFAGVRASSAWVPAGCFSGLDVGFQAIAIESWSGQPGWSPVVRVTFQ
ncbi:MAG: hypothetical protein EXS13_01585 [Planctomycetes bacterium]|nr:hypothetical protein [Planctomycetota bacterium]